jgi:hypothetical protein
MRLHQWWREILLGKNLPDQQGWREINKGDSLQQTSCEQHPQVWESMKNIRPKLQIWFKV